MTELTSYYNAGTVTSISPDYENKVSAYTRMYAEIFCH